MMKNKNYKKNGFVSTSLIYTFFILFLLLMIFLMNNYTSMRYIVEQYRINFRNDLKELSSADINLYFEVWDDVVQEYKISNEFPGSEYEFEDISFCINGSLLSYDDGHINIAAKGKDYCYVYFRNSNQKVVYRIYTKELSDSEDYKGTFVRGIPDYTYEFTSYNCTNGEVVTFDEETRKLSVASSVNTTCEIIFTKKDTDVTLNIFVEDISGDEEYNSKKYSTSSEVPTEGYIFDSYNCKDSSVITEIGFEENEIVVKSSGDNECSVYFNLE